MAHLWGGGHWVPDVDATLLSAIRQQLVEVTGAAYGLWTAVKEGLDEDVLNDLINGSKVVFDARHCAGQVLSL